MKRPMAWLVGATFLIALYLMASAVLPSITADIASTADKYLSEMQTAALELRDTVLIGVEVLIIAIAAVVLAAVFIRLLKWVVAINRSRGPTARTAPTASSQSYTINGPVAQIGQSITNTESPVNATSIQYVQLSDVERGLDAVLSSATRGESLDKDELNQLLTACQKLRTQAELSPKERNRHLIRELFDRIPILLTTAHESRQVWNDWAPAIARFLGL